MRICVVCRGNIHRSPVAAHALARTLAAEGIEVVSAGLDPVPGAPVPRKLLAVAADRGLDLSSHRARPVVAEIDVDLFLTMTRQQARQLWLRNPVAPRRTMPIGELPLLIAHSHPQDLEHLISIVAGRDQQLLLGAGSADVPDPVSDSSRVYRKLVDQLLAIGTRISATLPARRS